MDKKINIIGYGFIGQATAIGLTRMGYEVSAFDIQKKVNIYGVEEFNRIPLVVGEDAVVPPANINIVCIADKNLEDGRQEVGHIAKVLDNLTGKGMVILRTTMLPRFLSSLKFDFYWPEFLRERKAIEEFMNPEFTVIGRTNDKEFPFKDHFSPLFYCTPEEASHIKYLSNIWNAARISFVNEFGRNLIQENIKKENVLDFFFKGQKYLKWGNAFGGHCLPKDTNAYIKEYPDLLILKSVIESNNKHRKKYPELDSSPVYHPD